MSKRLRLLPGEAERDDRLQRLAVAGVYLALVMYGVLLGYVAALAARAWPQEHELEAARDTSSALRVERDVALVERDDLYERLEVCRAANESSALALHALAAREDGCRRFLCLDPYSGGDVCAGETDWMARRLARAEGP